MTMKQRLFVSFLLLCVAMAFVTDTSDAQNRRTGTAAATELLIPVGARDMAMGGSTLASSQGVEALYWNPAGLGRIGYGAEGMFSTMSYIADINVSYGAIAAAFGDFGNIGLSIKSLDFGDIPLTTNEDPEGRAGRIYSPTYVTLGLTYARSLTDAISAGLTAKLIAEQIDRASATGFAFDIGVQYSGLVGVSGLQLGVAIKNVGPQMKFDGSGLYRTATSSDGRRPEQQYKSEAASFELPSLVEIGLAYRRPLGESMMYNVNGSFTNNNLYLDEYRFGGELGYTVDALTLFGRAGMGIVAQAEDDANIFGATLGFGLAYTMPGMTVSFDYAFRQVDFFDNNNVFSLKLGF
jgi:hypothetical protein